VTLLYCCCHFNPSSFYFWITSFFFPFAFLHPHASEALFSVRRFFVLCLPCPLPFFSFDPHFVSTRSLTSQQQNFLFFCTNVPLSSFHRPFFRPAFFLWLAFYCVSEGYFCRSPPFPTTPLDLVRFPFEFFFFRLPSEQLTRHLSRLCFPIDASRSVPFFLVSFSLSLDVLPPLFTFPPFCLKLMLAIRGERSNRFAMNGDSFRLFSCSSPIAQSASYSRSYDSQKASKAARCFPFVRRLTLGAPRPTLWRTSLASLSLNSLFSSIALWLSRNSLELRVF